MKHSRFLDIHVTNGKNYDFRGDVIGQKNYQKEKNKYTTYAPHQGSINKTPKLTNPNINYIHVYIDIMDIKNGTKRTGIERIISWLDNCPAGKQSKLRINVHGDGNGNICMRDENDKWKTVDAACIVTWLINNGFKGKRLKTISLALCMAARKKQDPAKVSANGQTTKAALKSAVDKVASLLGSKKLTGIEVTGSSEEVMMGNTNSNGHQGQLGRIVEIPSAWILHTDNKEYRLGINGAHFDAHEENGNTPGHLKLRKDYKTRLEKTKEESWEIIDKTAKVVATFPTTGWIVSTSGVITPPVGWRVVKENGIGKLVFSCQGVTVSQANGGVCSIWQRLAHTNAKARAIS